ncbi:hypothetical protein JAAARDRAFT_200929 [Jaapia argillacea MUCL 33604]|uniref:Uncharacterized protein n=1 Tax=Jaapia argillacea MUCL 33604 TaxID=933084 RepID=A0A067PFV0_9AGAM|nr:hypothetical protein JAAARDRAFT_200929 [Jaapia argillacea MUCL 33604]
MSNYLIAGSSSEAYANAAGSSSQLQPVTDLLGELVPVWLASKAELSKIRRLQAETQATLKRVQIDHGRVLADNEGIKAYLESVWSLLLHHPVQPSLAPRYMPPPSFTFERISDFDGPSASFSFEPRCQLLNSSHDWDVPQPTPGLTPRIYSEAPIHQLSPVAESPNPQVQPTPLANSPTTHTEVVAESPTPADVPSADVPSTDVPSMDVLTADFPPADILEGLRGVRGQVPGSSAFLPAPPPHPHLPQLTQYAARQCHHPQANSKHLKPPTCPPYPPHHPLSQIKSGCLHGGQTCFFSTVYHSHNPTNPLPPPASSQPPANSTSVNLTSPLLRTITNAARAFVNGSFVLFLTICILESQPVLCAIGFIPIFNFAAVNLPPPISTRTPPRSHFMKHVQLRKVWIARRVECRGQGPKPHNPTPTPIYHSSTTKCCLTTSKPFPSPPMNQTPHPTHPLPRTTQAATPAA